MMDAGMDAAFSATRQPSKFIVHRATILREFTIDVSTYGRIY